MLVPLTRTFHSSPSPYGLWRVLIADKFYGKTHRDIARMLENYDENLMKLFKEAFELVSLRLFH
jgi:hypothetical protein